MEFKPMKAKEIARRLGKSISWVYANGHHLGGAKIGGAWIFEEEEVQRAISRARRQMARNGHGGQAAKDKAVSHKKGRKKVGSRKKGGVEIWGADTGPRTAWN